MFCLQTLFSSVFSNVYQKQAAQFFLLLLLLPFFLSIDGETIPIASLTNENHFEKCFGQNNKSRVKIVVIDMTTQYNRTEKHSIHTLPLKIHKASTIYNSNCSARRHELDRIGSQRKYQQSRCNEYLERYTTTEYVCVFFAIDRSIVM